MWVRKNKMLYRLNSINLIKSDLHRLESTQGGLIKKCLNISACSHHPKLLSALNIPPVKELEHKESLSLPTRVSEVESL